MREPKFKHLRTREDFIKRAIERHLGFYSYDKVEFTPRSPVKNWKGEQKRKTSEYYRDEKIIIICPTHGDFVQTARKHIEKDPSGCQKCAQIKRVETRNQGNSDWKTRHASTTEDFIKKSNAIWGEGTWDYSRVEYKSNHYDSQGNLNYAEIGCPVHGFFKQLPTNHYRWGCDKCAKLKMSKKYRMPVDKLLSRLKEIHLDKYDYSKLIKNWTGCHERLQDGAKRSNRSKKYEIICKVHGPFKISIQKHLYRGQGCPECNPTVSHGEKTTRKIFEEVFKGYKFKKVKPKWLINPKTNRKLELDGYNKELKLAFEYQGHQHYEAIEIWGGSETLRGIQERDEIKRKLCEVNGITLVEIDSRPMRNRSLPTINKHIKKIVQGITKCQKKY